MSKKSAFENEIILVSRNFFFVNTDVKNGCKNEFEDNNEKSCSQFKNRVPLKSILGPLGLTSSSGQPES